MSKKQRISERLRQQVRERANGRCEYCLIHEDDVAFPHEADHIIAEKHGGTATLDNLAWACAICNRYKGTDVASVVQQSGQVAALYNPRRQVWSRHFRYLDGRIEPLTVAGRVTAALLHFNDPRRVEERRGLAEIGRYPPH